MIRLIDILKELNIPKPEDAYPLSEPVKSRGTGPNSNMVSQKFNFDNAAGDNMTIEINTDESNGEMFVVFYRTEDSDEEGQEEDGEEKYARETKSGDMIKVLATVVEAIKRAAKNLGGMDKIEKIRMQPADKRRYNIYTHYAETLFPDFIVKKAGSWISLINKNYKPEEVTEILEPKTADKYDLVQVKPKKKKGEEDLEDGKLKPTSSFTFSDRSTEKSYVWTYKNRNGNKMDMTITFETEEGGKNPKMILAFGVANKDVLSKYGKMTGAGDLKTILRTMIEAAEQVIGAELGGDKQSLMAVGFEPSDDRRKRIYDYFIKNNFGQFKSVPDKDKMKSLGLNQHFDWYVNQHYKA